MRDYKPRTWNGIASQVVRDVYKKIGNRIAKDITNQYISVIKSFYADYYPRVYRRKYRSYYFLDTGGAKPCKKFIKMDKDGKGFTVGIELNPNNITHPYTSIVNGKGTKSLTNLVFLNTWVLGQHGGQLPYSILPSSHQEIIDGAYKDHNAPRWRPLKTGFTWIPPVMDTPPMEQMDKWFATYATDANLDSITREIVTASINKYISEANKRYNGVTGRI